MGSALRKVISVKEVNNKDSKMGFYCSLQMIPGNPSQVNFRKIQSISLLYISVVTSETNARCRYKKSILYFYVEIQ